MFTSLMGFSYGGSHVPPERAQDLLHLHQIDKSLLIFSLRSFRLVQKIFDHAVLVLDSDLAQEAVLDLAERFSLQVDLKYKRYTSMNFTEVSLAILKAFYTSEPFPESDWFTLSYRPLSDKFHCPKCLFQ